ncbi:Pentatricopeptide repeat [Dillenia turbinata]|uniref:Pentatricopeptide repeat n=1 Tax=Dillenia turbinata TaxID=194707 RepID=A0AAN8UXQ9_9MAGN
MKDERVFGEGGYFKEVVTLFRDMVEENVEPNMETYEGLIFACGKGGLYEDAQEILLHMTEKDAVLSSKAYTGVIEAYWQAALYEEALVAFNTMNEVGNELTVETYNILIHMSVRSYVKMEKTRSDPDEWTLETVLSVYCSAGLVHESKEQFKEIKGLGWDDALKVLDEMLANRASNIHQFQTVWILIEEPE